MSYMGQMTAQDPMMLLKIGAALALFLASVSAPGGNYNFPLMCFGMVGHELPGSPVLYKQFATLLISSFIFDLFHLSTSYGLLTTIIFFLLLALKLPLYLSTARLLTDRGEPTSLSASFSGFTRGFGQARDRWAERGAAQGGYQPVGGGGFTSAPAPAGGPAQPAPRPTGPPGSFPSSGGFTLGSAGEEEGRGGYQG